MAFLSCNTNTRYGLEKPMATRWVAKDSKALYTRYLVGSALIAAQWL